MTEYAEQLPAHLQFPHPVIPGFQVTEIRYSENGFYLCGWQTLNAPKTPPSEPLSPLQRMHLSPRPPESRVPSSTFHPHNTETLAAYYAALRAAAAPTSAFTPEQDAQARAQADAPQIPLTAKEAAAARAQIGIRYPQTGRGRG